MSNRAIASSDRHEIEDAGERPHVGRGDSYGVAVGVLPATVRRALSATRFRARRALIAPLSVISEDHELDRAHAPADGFCCRAHGCRLRRSPRGGPRRPSSNASQPGRSSGRSRAWLPTPRFGSATIRPVRMFRQKGLSTNRGFGSYGPHGCRAAPRPCCSQASLHQGCGAGGLTRRFGRRLLWDHDRGLTNVQPWRRRRDADRVGAATGRPSGGGMQTRIRVPDRDGA